MSVRRIRQLCIKFSNQKRKEKDKIVFAEIPFFPCKNSIPLPFHSSVNIKSQPLTLPLTQSVFLQVISPTRRCPLQGFSLGFRASSATSTIPALDIQPEENPQALFPIIITRCKHNSALLNLVKTTFNLIKKCCFFVCFLGGLFQIGAILHQHPKASAQ